MAGTNPFGDDCITPSENDDCTTLVNNDDCITLTYTDDCTTLADNDDCADLADNDDSTTVNESSKDYNVTLDPMKNAGPAENTSANKKHSRHSDAALVYDWKNRTFKVMKESRLSSQSYQRLRVPWLCDRIRWNNNPECAKQLKQASTVEEGKWIRSGFYFSEKFKYLPWMSLGDRTRRFWGGLKFFCIVGLEEGDELFVEFTRGWVNDDAIIFLPTSHPLYDLPKASPQAEKNPKA